MLSAGKLTTPVRFQRITESQSASGAVTETAQDILSAWAEKVEERSLEGFREEQQQGWAMVVFRTHYFRDGDEEPTVKWQIVEGDRVYEILDVREIGYRAGWEFVARARAEDQAA